MASSKSIARRLAWVAAGLTMLLAGCADNVQVHGNMPDPEVIAEIQRGVSRRDDVVDLLGSPSTVSTFQDDRWYYIGQKIEQFAFFKPEILDRRILVVSFDGNGMVEDTRTYALEDGLIIDPVGRETPTEGRDLTFLQQIFGNIGRLPADVFQKQ